MKIPASHPFTRFATPKQSWGSSFKRLPIKKNNKTVVGMWYLQIPPKPKQYGQILSCSESRVGHTAGWTEKKTTDSKFTLHSEDRKIYCCGFVFSHLAPQSVKIPKQCLHLIGFGLCSADNFLPDAFDFSLEWCWAEGGLTGPPTEQVSAGSAETGRRFEPYMVSLGTRFWWLLVVCAGTSRCLHSILATVLFIVSFGSIFKNCVLQWLMIKN